MGLKGQQFERVLFTTAENPVRMHNCVLQHGNRAVASMDANMFCHDIIEAARAWYAMMKDDPVVIANMSNLVHYRPHGLAPFFVGDPVIA